MDKATVSQDLGSSIKLGHLTLAALTAYNGDA